MKWINFNLDLGSDRRDPNQRGPGSETLLYYCYFRQGQLKDQYDDIEPFFELKSNAATAAAGLLPATDTSFSASLG